MGIVYRARHPAMDADLALKVLISEEANAEDIERFLQEARAISRIRHRPSEGRQVAKSQDPSPS